jgi:serine phosphatase RsbU (regulator of sigma subunit)
MAAARLEHDGRKLSFEGGGHPPAFWVTREGECRLLDSRSAVLGALEEAVDPAPPAPLELEPGDRLALYTDGLTEVFNEKEEMLGIEGLQEIVRQAARQPLAEMKESIIEQVSAFRHGPVHDDMSLVLVEIH